MDRPRALLFAATLALGAPLRGESARFDLSGYSPRSGVEARVQGDLLTLEWPVGGGEERGLLGLEVKAGAVPLLTLGSSGTAGGPFQPVLPRMEPRFSLTAGSREAPGGRPPDMSVFNVFFDSPASRPHQTHSQKLEPKEARVRSAGRRATVSLDGLALGPFKGEMEITVHAGSRLVLMEAVVSTSEDRRAFIYEAGLAGDGAKAPTPAYLDTEGRLQRGEAAEKTGPRPIAVRHRTIIAETANGSVAFFPPPHRFFFPRDLTDNLRCAWHGEGLDGSPGRYGFGIRQQADGGGSFVPWFNAPPGTRQRLGIFLLLSRGRAEEVLRETLRYTRGDRFDPLPGHLTFTSHWHLAAAVSALERVKRGLPPAVPDFVAMFRELGVQAVHLAEFHGDGHPGDPGPLRLPEMEAMFSECRRLSGPGLLFIPGEEGNDFLGIREPGKHPGHWMCVFPRPIYWTMKRAPGQPFLEEEPRLGKVYHVGGREDMVELLKREHGLAWSSHPRIKASSWAPDIFRRESFYLDEVWLGAAWKAMPADLSRERLGERALDLLDDMSNWGQRKYLPGEVDVFKLDHTHELYGHLNVNYLRLDRVPRFEEGWQPILDALRAGRFFVTTGEVLLLDFTVGGKRSGETLPLARGETPEVRAQLSWTFPMNFAEVISGDGKKVHRERIDLSDTGPFEERALSLKPDLGGRSWARFEAWDIAGNGAFSQPVWLAGRGE